MAETKPEDTETGAAKEAEPEAAEAEAAETIMETETTEKEHQSYAEAENDTRTAVSFVIPCYRSAQTLPKVVKEIRDTCASPEMAARYRYEIILVCDGSPDNTFEVIRALAGQNGENGTGPEPDVPAEGFADGAVTGINLSTNFGQHAALMAGMRQAAGDVVICLDDDGQTPASECGLLLAKLEEGYDAVYAAYDHKQHSGFRNFGSRLNDWMTRVMLDKPAELYISSYFAARRFVIDEMLRYQNAYPYVIGLLLRATKNIANVPVNHRRREEGISGYTFVKLLSLWLNGFTSFSIKPLRIATLTGALFACIGFLYGLWTVVKKLFIRPDIPIGWSSLMAAQLVIGGILLLMLGLIGEYIGRIYISMNSAPQYVIRETVRGLPCGSNTERRTGTCRNTHL